MTKTLPLAAIGAVALGLAIFPGEAPAQHTVFIGTEGNLASQRSSMLGSIDEASSADTPVDLIDLGARLAKSGDDKQGALAFAVGLVYGRYDILRVADKTAHQGIEVLAENAMGQLTQEQADALRKAAGNMLKGGAPELLSLLNRMGRPTYTPTYMIQHGLRAFTGGMPNGGIVQDFDADAAWAGILEELRTAN